MVPIYCFLEIRGEYVMGFYKQIDDLKTNKLRVEQIGNSNQTVITKTVIINKFRKTSIRMMYIFRLLKVLKKVWRQL